MGSERLRLCLVHLYAPAGIAGLAGGAGAASDGRRSVLLSGAEPGEGCGGQARCARRRVAHVWLPYMARRHKEGSGRREVVGWPQRCDGQLTRDRPSTYTLLRSRRLPATISGR